MKCDFDKCPGKPCGDPVCELNDCPGWEKIHVRAGLKSQPWERQILKAMTALPALPVFLLGMLAAGTVVVCSRLLALLGYR